MKLGPPRGAVSRIRGPEPVAGSAPVLLALTFALLLTGMAYMAMSRTGGRFGYALDDAYIHLAISRNLAQRGLWGVTRYATSSASSSPLWTLLLAGGMALFGDQVVLPFVLNVAFAVLAGWLVHRRLAAAGFSRRAAAGWTAGIVVGGPLAVLAFTGMEHNLHVFLVVLYAGWLLRLFHAESPTGQELALTVGITAMLTLARFESGFLVVAPIAMALRRRQFLFGGALVTGPALAVGGFALYSTAVGMPPIPNSIVLKGTMPHGSVLAFVEALGQRFADNVFNPTGRLVFVIVLLAVGVAMALRKRELPASEPIRVLLWTLIVAAALQSVLGSFGWFYRYEAYLVVSLSLAILLGLRQWPMTRGASVAGAALCAALVLRGYDATSKVPAATQDIYTQQVQMAKFIRRFYRPGTRVAVNDIGAVCYFGDVRLLDLWGLASDDVRTLKQHGRYDTAAISELVKRFHPEVVALYPAWFQGAQRVPITLHDVASWTIPPTTSAAFPLVVFYAASPAAEARLRSALAHNRPLLPPAVVQETLAAYPW